MTTESDDEHVSDATEALAPGIEGAEVADPTVDSVGSGSDNGTGESDVRADDPE